MRNIWAFAWGALVHYATRINERALNQVVVVFLIFLSILLLGHNFIFSVQSFQLPSLLVQSLLSSIQQETLSLSSPNPSVNSFTDLNPWTQSLIGVIQLSAEDLTVKRMRQ